MINQWVAKTLRQQRAAQHTLDQLHTARVGQHQILDPAMVRVLLEEPGDLAAGLDLADPQQRARFYQAMGISGLYQPAKRIVLITAEQGVCRPTGVGGPNSTICPRKVTTTLPQ